MSKTALIAKRSEVEAYADSLEQQINAAKQTQASLREQRQANIKAYNERLEALTRKYQAIVDAEKAKGVAKVEKLNSDIDAAINDEDLEIVLLAGELNTARRQATELTARIADNGLRNGENSF